MPDASGGLAIPFLVGSAPYQLLLRVCAVVHLVPASSARAVSGWFPLYDTQRAALADSSTGATRSVTPPGTKVSFFMPLEPLSTGGLSCLGNTTCAAALESAAAVPAAHRRLLQQTITVPVRSYGAAGPQVAVAPAPLTATPPRAPPAPTGRASPPLGQASSPPPPPGGSTGGPGSRSATLDQPPPPLPAPQSSARDTRVGPPPPPPSPRHYALAPAPWVLVWIILCMWLPIACRASIDRYRDALYLEGGRADPGSRGERGVTERDRRP